MKPVFIQRIGSGYNSEDLNNEFASATGIRNEIIHGNLDNISKFIPKNCHEQLKEMKPILPEDFNQIIGYKLISENSFEHYYDISPFLSNRINHYKYDFIDINHFITTLQSKNYTFSGISRSIAHVMLEITQKDIDSFNENGYTPYGRLLAFRKNSNILSLIKKSSSIEIISKFSSYYKNCDGISRKVLDINIHADMLYRMIYMNKYKHNLPTEFERQIFIL